jgi:diacylglycerol kinase family enzyme
MSRFQVKVDDQPIRVNASEVMIANSKLMGLQPQIDGVEVDPSDGQLDVFIMRANSFRDYLGVASAFLMRHKREQASKLNHYHAEKSIEIRAETRMPVQADGEVLGDTPVMVRLIRSALYIVTPGNSSGSNA